MTRSDAHDGDEPRYGQRVSPEELAEILREQGIGPHSDDAGAPGLSNGSSQGPEGAGSGWGGADPYLREAQGGRGGAGAQPGGPPWRGPRPPAVHPDSDQGPRRRWRTFVAGLVIMLVIPFILGAVAVVTSLEGPLSSGAALEDNGEVYLDAGVPRGLYRTGMSPEPLDCAVSDPSGLAVELTGMEGAETVYTSFTPAVSGIYTVTCAGGTSDIVIGPAVKQGQVASAGRLVLAAMTCAVIGAIISAIGLVRLVRRPR